MSPNRSKRSIWIGGGIAVAAVLAIAFFTLDYPPDGSKSAGTVAPAQRYRAEQPKAGDVKLGDQAVAQLMQTEAFDRFVKDPSTRALALDANFLALARYNSEGLLAVASNPKALALVMAQAKSMQPDAQRQGNAKAQIEANQLEANAKSQPQINASLRPEAFDAFGHQGDALWNLARSPNFQVMASRAPDALIAAVHTQGFLTLAQSPSLADALVTAATQPNSNLQPSAK